MVLMHSQGPDYNVCTLPVNQSLAWAAGSSRWLEPAASATLPSTPYGSKPAVLGLGLGMLKARTHTVHLPC